MNHGHRAVVVVDLGFGDSGKGTVVDWLARHGARWVVRFNGGAQAGHNVVTPDGRHHTFAQFGSGTFVPGVRTLLSRFMVVHPTGLLVEAAHLAGGGCPRCPRALDREPRGLVITPFSPGGQSPARVRPRLGLRARVAWAWGDGGDALAHPDAAIRMRHPRCLRALQLLERIRETKRNSAAKTLP